MRCSLPLYSLVLLATGSLQAQHPRLGIKAGLNASTYAGTALTRSGYQFGPTGGLLLQWPLGKHVDLQPELLYEQRGAHLRYSHRTQGATFTAIDYSRTVRSRLHYGSLAPLVRLHQGPWFAVAGPQLSYLVDEKRVIKDQVHVIVGQVDPVLPDGAARTVRNTREYHRGEIGYVLGVGYEVSACWRVEGRYAAGFTKVRQPLVVADAIYGTDQVQQARNQSLQVQISYVLPARR